MLERSYREAFLEALRRGGKRRYPKQGALTAHLWRVEYLRIAQHPEGKHLTD
jgi:hypothetical protein